MTASPAIPTGVGRRGLAEFNGRLGCAPNKWMKSSQGWAHSPGDLAASEVPQGIGKRPRNPRNPVDGGLYQAALLHLEASLEMIEVVLHP